MNNLSKNYFLLSQSLFMIGKIKESHKAVNKAMDICKKIKNNLLNQAINIFSGYIKLNIDDKFSLKEYDKLNKNLDDKNSAIFYFLRWKISKSKKDFKEANNIFSKLYKTKASITYQYYINKLKK